MESNAQSQEHEESKIVRLAGELGRLERQAVGCGGLWPAAGQDKST